MKLKVIKSAKKRKPLLYIIFAVVAVLFLSVFVFTVSGIYAERDQKKAELLALQHEIQIQEMKNAEFESVYDDPEYFLKHVEKTAREHDYVKSGERVFINSSGK